MPTTTTNDTRNALAEAVADQLLKDVPAPFDAAMKPDVLAALLGTPADFDVDKAEEVIADKAAEYAELSTPAAATLRALVRAMKLTRSA